jgi:hypothetical protein
MEKIIIIGGLIIISCVFILFIIVSIRIMFVYCLDSKSIIEFEKNTNPII